MTVPLFAMTDANPLWSFTSKCVHYLAPTTPPARWRSLLSIEPGQKKSLSREKTQGEGKIGNQREEKMISPATTLALKRKHNNSGHLLVSGV